MLIERNLKIPNRGTRQEIRERLVYEFLKEEPGTGTKDLASRYRYYVEKLHSGNRIFLARPAPLNKGFDFIIRVEGMNFNPNGRKRTNPSLLDIQEDLCRKKKERPKLYAQLFRLIQQIYSCKQTRAKDYERLNFKTGFPTDLILFVIKWFFIEQDITYWNFSGRAMLMSKIPVPHK